jgi:formylglycine-generating enzyme required for sulfatase activity
MLEKYSAIGPARHKLYIKWGHDGSTALVDRLQSMKPFDPSHPESSNSIVRPPRPSNGFEEPKLSHNTKRDPRKAMAIIRTVLFACLFTALAPTTNGQTFFKPTTTFISLDCINDQNKTTSRNLKILKLEVDKCEFAFVYIQSGITTIGSPPLEEKREVNECQIRVCIKKFYLLQHEVSQLQYYLITGKKPSFDMKNEQLMKSFPVESITFRDAETFCELLSQRTGRRFRLPNCAEWEYACRGGSNKPYSFGVTSDGSTSNVLSEFPYPPLSKYRVSRGRVSKDTTFLPNVFGLYNMHGNVSEFVIGFGSGPFELRGGSYQTPAAESRSASKVFIDRFNFKSSSSGFRIAYYD